MTEKKFVRAEIVKIDDAQPGMVLAEDIRGDGGGVILTADTVLSGDHISRLQEFGVYRIFVEKQQSGRSADNPLCDKRAVVVSSSLFFRHMFGKQLYRHGLFVCDELEDASDGMRCARHYKPDLIILDLDNPENPNPVAGLAMLNNIHRKYPSIKLIAVSASKNTELIVATVRAGANGYMAKPIKWELLQERLVKAFEDSTLH